MDLYYIEEGYYDAGYYVYTANAQAAPTVISSVSCNAVKITEVQSAISSSFSVNAYGARTIDIDLFAFSDAAIAVQVDRIRGNNIEATAVFNIATSVERIQQGDADADAIFSAIINGLRSRDVNLETQAAFSFASIADKIKLVNITINSESSLSCEATEITPFIDGESAFTSQFTLSADCGKILQFASVVNATANLTATISLIKDVNLTAFTNAAISAQAERLRNSNSDISSSSSLSSGIELTKLGSSDITSTSSISCVISHIHGADIEAQNFASISAQAQATLNGVVAIQSQVDTFIDGDAIRVAVITTTSAFTISVNANVFKDIQSNQISAFTNVIDAVKNVGITQNLTAQSNVYCQITNYRGIDMFAFTNNSLAVDAVVIRNAVSNASVSVSLSGAGVLVRQGDSQCQSSFTQTADANRLRDNNSQCQSSFTQTADANRVRNGDSSQTSTFDLTASARIVKDAHLTAADSITLNVNATITAQGAGSLEVLSSISSNVGLQVLASSNISFQATIFVSRNVGDSYERPHNLVDNFINGQPGFDTNIKKFGTSSYSGTLIGKNNTNTVPTAAEDFYWEAWIYPKTGTGNIFSTTYWLRVDFLSNQRFRISFQLPVSPNSYPAIGYAFTGANNTLALNTWHHIAVVKTYTSMSYYINGVRVYNVTDTNIPNGFYGPDNGNFWGSYTGYVADQSMYLSGNTTNIDEVFYVRNSTYGYNPNDTTINVPTAARTNGPNVQALWHFDGNVNDDLSLTFNTSANLISNANISAVGNYTIAGASSNIVSTASLSAIIGKLQEINLVAFDDAELTAAAGRIQQGAVSIQSNSSITCDAAKKIVNSVSSTSSFSQSANLDRIRNASVITESIFSELVVGEQNIGVIAHLTNRFYTERPYVDVGYVGEGYAEIYNTSAIKTASGVANLNVNATLTASAISIVSFASLVMSAGTMTVNAVKTTDALSSSSAVSSVATAASKTAVSQQALSAVFTTSIKGDKSGDIALYAFTNATLNIQPDIFRITGASLATASTFYFDSSGALFQQADAAVNVSTAVNVSGNRIRFGAITTEAIASELVVVVKTTAVDVDMVVNSTLTVEASKFKIISVAISASASQSTTAIKTARGTSAISSAMAFAVSYRDLRIDEIEYRIPAEGWAYSINGETRLHSVVGETRLLKITEETAIKPVASETRIHIID